MNLVSLKEDNLLFLTVVFIGTLCLDGDSVAFFQRLIGSSSLNIDLASGLLLPFFVLAGEGGGACGSSSDSGYSVDVHSTSVSVTDHATGATYSGTMDAMGNFDCSNGMSFGGIGEPSSGGASTPFLRVWDGTRFALENDFLFGKPNTSFTSKEVGEREYRSGAVGGDTYVLQGTPAESDGLLKMQIREIEPEESFIDSLALFSVDLSPREHLIVNGNLKEFLVFNLDAVQTVSQKEIYLLRAGTTTVSPVQLAYNSLGEGRGRSLVMNTGDEMILHIPASVAQNSGQDLYILIDSHYRDWTLSNEVPFSLIEQLGFAVHSIMRSSFSFVAGLAMLGGGILGLLVRDGGLIPYTYADTPHTGGSGNSSDGSYYGGRSLMVTAQDGPRSFYLETIFPRYARATQEVIKVPRDFLASLEADFFTVHIRATKKHKVRAAFVFVGKAMIKTGKSLRLVSAFHDRLQADVSDRLTQKDLRYLETIPGDVVNLSWQTIEPPTVGETRKYVLKADGFYSRLSEATKRVIGLNWYGSLDSDDKKILRSFKRQQAL